eukprot:930442-Rhodomonas_salina.1
MAYMKDTLETTPPPTAPIMINTMVDGLEEAGKLEGQGMGNQSDVQNGENTTKTAVISNLGSRIESRIGVRGLTET